MRIERAETGDWPAVRGLLSEAGLPLEGAAEAFARGIVVRDGDRVIGCAAIEPYEGAALLRSVAVAPDQRGTGVGTSLVHEAEDLAHDGGASTVILLTETTEGWFGRLGYAVVERSNVPADVSRSIEFETACSTTAVAMQRALA